jgi:hypothetical protein
VLGLPLLRGGIDRRVAREKGTRGAVDPRRRQSARQIERRDPGQADQLALLFDMQRGRHIPALLAAQRRSPAPQQRHGLPVLHHAALAKDFHDGVDVVAGLVADAGNDQGASRDLPQFLAVQHRAAAQLPFEQWQGRAIGGLVAPFGRRGGGDLVRPQHAAMAIGGGRGLLMPHRKIAFPFQAFRRLLFCLAGFRRPSLQQGDLLLGGDRVPIDPLARSELAGRILRFDRPLAE